MSHCNSASLAEAKRSAQDCTGLHRIARDCMGLHRIAQLCLASQKVCSVGMVQEFDYVIHCQSAKGFIQYIRNTGWFN